MRRSDREVTDFEEICAIVDRGQVARLGLCDGDRPYVVPLNYGWAVEQGTLVLYFHCARQGRKLDIMAQNPKACFEVDGALKIVRGDESCDWTAGYESVIGEGVLEEVTSEEDKRAGLGALMRHYGDEAPSFPPQALARVCVLRLAATAVTGKKNVR